MAPDKTASARAEKLLRSRRYVGLLIIAAILGVLISAAAYWFLKLINLIQGWVYTDLPHGLGFSSTPAWWPVLPLFVAGVTVGATIRYLPGRGGEVPADGFKAGGVTPAVTLPGIAVAALASICLGAVVGPESPLIALGGGLAVLMVRLVKRDLPEQAAAIMAATGSFAAIATLLGSPIVGAFLLMEVTGRPTVAEFGWALAIGVLAGLACWLLRQATVPLRPLVDRWTVPAVTVIALAIAGLAIGFAEATGHTDADVLFSGQNQLPSLIEQAAGYSVGALLLLMLCKGLAYAGSLVGFRGGPTFPAMFIGAAGGIAMSHLPGLALIPAAAMGVGAMTVGMLRLPFTAVLLTTLFFGNDGITVMPLVIVAVVVAHVTTIRLSPPPADGDSTQPQPPTRTPSPQRESTPPSQASGGLDVDRP